MPVKQNSECEQNVTRVL